MNKEQKLQTRTTFIDFANANRLRLKYDEAKDPICVTISKRYKDDHLYDGFLDCFGVSVTRNTKTKLNHVITRLEALGCTLKQKGETEANLKVPFDKALEVAKTLGFIKGTQGNIDNFKMPPHE